MRRPRNRTSLAAWCFVWHCLSNDAGQSDGVSQVSASMQPSYSTSGISVATALESSSGGSSSFGGRRRPSEQKHSERRRGDSRFERRKGTVSESSITTQSTENLWDDDFVPLVFSEDELEEEERILSALARIEETDDKPGDRRRNDFYEREGRSTTESSSSDLSQPEKSYHRTAKDSTKRELVREVSPPMHPDPKKDSPTKIKQRHREVATSQHPWSKNLVARVGSRTPDAQSVTGSQLNSTSKPGASRPSSSFGVSGAAFLSSNQASGHQSGADLTTTATLHRSHHQAVSHAPTYRASTSSTVSAPHSASHSQSTVSQTHQAPQHMNPAAPSTTTPWIRRFLSSRPKDALLPIPRSYISDGFNLVQLAPIVERIAAATDGYNSELTPGSHKQPSSSFPYYKAALRLILQEEDNPSAVPAVTQRCAETLYCLLHSRYIISPRGLDTVRRVMKRKSGVEPVFGRCPRIGCRGMALLPYGESDDMDLSASPASRSKRYCCCCGEKLFMWESNVDGCAWGPSFCHLFLLTYGEDVFPGLVRMYDSGFPPTEGGTSRMVTPSIFGFKLHPSCKARYPRNTVEC